LIAMWRTAEDSLRVGRLVAILTLVGAINLPIIKFSVECWNTLHQSASVLRFSHESISLACRLLGTELPPAELGPQVQALTLQKPTIDWSILLPLLSMAIAFALLFLTLQLAAMRNEILRRRVRSLRLMQAGAAGGA
jgi:heme exporter protein C